MAVDDLDDILQEELFGRPVTDLDSLWCSDWASEDVGDQHWPHTNTNEVPILTKKRKTDFSECIDYGGYFPPGVNGPKRCLQFSEMHVSKHWLQTKEA